MSPTEDQLRAALGEGAGSGLDADRVIGRAEAYRRQRRARVLATSATAIVVAAAGVGIGVAVTTPSNHVQSSAEGHASTALGVLSGNAKVPAPELAVSCPTSRPSVAATTSTSGNLFTANVVAVTVCGYRFTGAAIPVTQTYSGSDAHTIAASLESASRSSGVLHCDAIVANRVQSLAFLAQYANGTHAVTVVAQLGCTQTVTNGSTTRYEWTPPAVLSSVLAKMNVAAK